MNVHRKIIEIDEERCNGCGQCVLDCAEGAIRIVDGKAKVISDHLCDGLGACIGGCPQDALHIVERLAAPFDEQAVHEHLRAHPGTALPGALPVCPSALPSRGYPSARPALELNSMGSAVQWPVKLRLMPESASLLHRAGLLLTADCAPVVCRDFASLTAGKVVLTSCPKFEDTEALAAKVASICRVHALRGITVLRMEVPCCMGLARWVEKAIETSGQNVPLVQLCLKRDGNFTSGAAD